MKKLSHEQFLEMVPSKILKNFIFLSVYNGDANKVKLLGNDGGIYLISPTHIKNGKIPRMSSALNKNEVLLNKFNSIHNKKYTYDLSNYKNTMSKLKIICPTHGKFEQLVSDHLKGAGCRKCANEKLSIGKKFADDYFLDYCRKLFNNKYQYINFNYKNMYSVIDIICPIHGKFTKIARSHYEGSGCNECMKEFNGVGFTKTKWVKLGNISKYFDSFKIYIVKITGNGESFIKIGRTFITVKKRFCGELRLPKCYKIEILYTLIGNGEYIYDLEYKLHRKLLKYKYLPSIHFDGKYECFSTDCINYIHDIINNDKL